MYNILFIKTKYKFDQVSVFMHFYI